MRIPMVIVGILDRMCVNLLVMQYPEVSSEAEAAAGMAQLAASGGISRPSSSGPPYSAAHSLGGPLQNLGATLIALSRRIPIDVREVPRDFASDSPTCAMHDQSQR